MAEPSINAPRPLCVDLDGTLVKTDTFAQALLLLIRTRPATLFSCLRRSSGLAAFKRRIAQEIQLDPAALPYHNELLAFLKSENEKGRTLILATASDALSARAVAAHLGIFSDVIASDGITNFKSASKRDALVTRFGAKGFDYAGNASDDLAVWESAAAVFAVNPSEPVRHALKNRPVRFFEDRPEKWKAWLTALRVQQWIKNILIFLPMLLAHELTSPELYVQAVLAFFSFSFAASAIYVINDLMDLHADQHHPRKQNRPFAAGNLSLLAAASAVPVLILLSLGLAQLLPVKFTGVLCFYLLITTLYSWRIKQLVMLDVLALAGLYTVRILAGTAAYGVSTSGWLLAFSAFIFLSLALVKRYAELREALAAHPEKIGERGRGYHASHLPWLGRAGIISGTLSAVVLALYITSPKVLEFYNQPLVLWLLCPLVLYWILRIWRLALRGVLSDDPLEFAARDPQTWLIGALSAVVLILGTIL
jgi:4-hydroxybenzoate polyprenyltransferase